jgi:hypothetical protein
VERIDHVRVFSRLYQIKRGDVKSCRRFVYIYMLTEIRVGGHLTLLYVRGGPGRRAIASSTIIVQHFQPLEYSNRKWPDRKGACI